ncbi:MAG TPA: BadF/BadG/BcrA/BcrD ATPase family protein [Pilimelia sp.]|nr:BadF/BadG/BcrA/BcrD ATPase family protein [Pilimelia sp.]
MAALFAAIDGGNSKTHVVLGSTDGEVLAFVHGGGSSPHNLGVDGSIALLDELIGQARAVAGLAPDAELARAEIYLAGADLPVEVDVLTKAVADAGWAREHRVDNDTFALLRAGTDDLDAVAVVCGAGINCVGRTADGRSARFPALGKITGDWGGGHHLAWLALWHAARGEDGRGPATALSPAVAAFFDRTTVEEVGAGLHLGEIPQDRVGQLTGVLFAVAADGDLVARRVVMRQAEEVVGLVRVAAGRLNLLGSEFTVVFGGGVLTARHPLLHDAVGAGIRTCAPHARITVLSEPPVAGAALLALDALGASPAAGAALRAALTLPRLTVPGPPAA